jgi:hypothetical protein
MPMIDQPPESRFAGLLKPFFYTLTGQLQASQRSSRPRTVRHVLLRLFGLARRPQQPPAISADGNIARRRANRSCRQRPLYPPLRSGKTRRWQIAAGL